MTHLPPAPSALNFSPQKPTGPVFPPQKQAHPQKRHAPPPTIDKHATRRHCQVRRRSGTGVIAPSKQQGMRGRRSSAAPRVVRATPPEHQPALFEREEVRRRHRGWVGWSARGGVVCWKSDTNYGCASRYWWWWDLNWGNLRMWYVVGLFRSSLGNCT